MVKEFVDEVNIPTYKWGDVGSISYNEDYYSEYDNEDEVVLLVGQEEEILPATPNNPQTLASNRKRDSNTVHKNALSSFRKSIRKALKGRPHLRLLKDLLSKICSKKNQSTFPYLVIFCQLNGFHEEVLFHWNTDSYAMLLKFQGKFTQARFAYLEKFVKRMNYSLTFTTATEITTAYWDNHKQKSKFYESLRTVKYFEANEIQRLQSQEA